MVVLSFLAKLFIYSFFGWIILTIIETIKKRKLTFGGLIDLPFSLLFGMNITVASIVYTSIDWNPFLFFVFLLSLSAIMEYAYNFLTEQIFSIRFWDYSKEKYNLDGRVSLKSTIMCAILSFLTIIFTNEFVTSLITHIDISQLEILVSLLLCWTIIKVISATGTIFKFSFEIETIDKEYKKLLEKKKVLSYKSIKKISKSDNNPERRLGASRILVYLDHMTTTEKDFKKLKKIHISKYENTINLIREYIEIKHPNIEESFAKGLNIYKLFWIFMIGCVIGYIIETIFCFVVNGYFECKQGMLYGPLNQIYGIGAVILTVVLNRFKGQSDLFIFIFSGLLGGLIETGLAYLEEILFHSRSWNYSKEMFGIFGGRTTIFLMLAWAILGLFFIRVAYPWLSKKIESIPNKKGKVITIIVFILVLINAVLTVLAVYRWEERLSERGAADGIWKIIDKEYPDEYMKRVYPKSKFKR